MVVEAAVLRLSGTVVNAAAQLWLGGRREKQERLLEMDELVRVRVPGLRFQREVRQQFEQITNAVYDRLEPHLRHAFQRLDEGGQQAVLDGVVDTLSQADLTDGELLAVNVQPAALVRRIVRAVSPPVGLSEAESRLYEALFAECVEYYVRIVRNLPVFEGRAAAELLARTATLGAEVARILERLPDRSLFAPEGTDHDTDFRRRYLELVSRDLDEVELFRRTTDQASAPSVRLSVAYVSLRTTGGDGGQRSAVRALLPLRPDMSRWEDGGDVGSAGQRVEAALSGGAKVLLRGEAGSGKTTLLRWLAVMAARGSFHGELAAWNGLTPILIKLREYSGGALPGPEGMVDGVAGPISGVMPRGWVERQLDGGGVLLLIDGVDELLDRERRAVRVWLRKLLDAYEGVRVVVTSRPAAAGADWLRREGFTSLHLDRMTPPDLAAFVRQWHQAVRELGDELPIPVEEVPRYEQALLASLKDRAHLQSLAGTPLLAAMLCAMHLNRGRQLPRDRMELYRNALHTLVHERDADRNVPSAVDSTLSLGDKLVILRDLAWRLSDNNRSEIDVAKAAGYVSAKLRTMRHLDALDGEQVLEQLRHRSGILRSPAQGRLDFVHRTFQEYLAAKEATEEDRIGNLVGRAHLDLWRETLIMVAGHATTRQREELLGGILDRAEREPRHARRLRLLAASCQETLPAMSEELAGRVDQAVKRVLPARRMTDPPALAAVGTSLLRWLPRSLAGLTEKSAAQTVRTVALIGGEEALALLEGYVGDERGGVVEAFIGAWVYFDADLYVDRVLSRVPVEDRQVRLAHPGQMRAAARLGPLVDLVVFYPMRDASVLAGLAGLTSLTVHVSAGQDLSGLLLIPGLEFLALVLPDTACDLSPLRGLNRLKGLILVGPPALTGPVESPDLDELGGMATLRRLTFAWQDVRSWLNCHRSSPPALEHLDLLRCVVPYDGGAFARLEELKRLTLRECRTADGQPVATFDVPGVRTKITS
ncbi:NACHT domain-containing protein [Streptomyces sp. NPDC057702]|uniref:NACHT domain-containing protein n=1 Tax=unclassified Streptomyces TaxID=2593676 RepID=UPI0036799C5E